MTDTGIDDLVKRMSRTRDGNQRLIDALDAQNDALDAAIKVLNGDAPPPAPTPPPKPAPKESRPAPRETRKGKPDYTAIAAWINKAKTDGFYSVAGLAKAFDTTESLAKNWPGKCKALGLLTVEIRNVKPKSVATGRREFTIDDAHNELAK